VRIEINGIQYAGFVAANATSRLDTLSDTFAFEATSEEADPLPFRLGDACSVWVDDEKVLTGFVELINVDGDSESHMIDIQGRDKTADLLDSTIGALDDLKPPISLKRALERVIQNIGSSLSVVDLEGPALFNAAEDLASPEPGQNAFEFAELLARKRQVLLTSDAEGRLVIASSTGTKVDAWLRHRVDDDTNNVISYSTSYDSTGRFNAYKAINQLNAGSPLNLAGIISTDTVVDQTSKVVRDQQIRAGRQFVLVAESAFSAAEGEKRAKWERNIRRARGSFYSARVDGYRNQAGDLWAINTLVPVVDEYAGIRATMLVNSVNFTLEGDGGTSTTLGLVEEDVYSIAAAEPEEPSDEEGGLGIDFLG
jgi:prophage tail gpP-like protein